MATESEWQVVVRWMKEHIAQKISEIAGVSIKAIQFSLRRYLKRGSVKDRIRTSRPLSATNRRMYIVQKRVPKRSVRKTARELSMSTDFIRGISRENTHSCDGRKKKFHLEICRALLKRFSSDRHITVIDCFHEESNSQLSSVLAIRMTGFYLVRSS